MRGWGERAGRKQLGQQQGQAETPSVCQPLALACYSQTTVIACKGAKTMGSEPLKPVVDAPAYMHTHPHTLCACGMAGTCQEKLSSLEGGHISLNRVKSEREGPGFHSTNV